MTKPDFIIRLKREMEELDLKIDKLSDYLLDEDREKEKAQENLLKIQLGIMKSYEQVLTVRLNLLEG